MTKIYVMDLTEEERASFSITYIMPLLSAIVKLLLAGRR